MSEMINRIAKVLLDADGRYLLTDDPDDAEDNERVIGYYRPAAKLALEAMLTPTNEMLHAAAKAMSPGRRPTPHRVSVKEKHRIRYQAMIDAALASPPASETPDKSETETSISKSPSSTDGFLAVAS